MFKRLVASLAVMGTALSALLIGVPAAQASTGGTPDGELHPSVGMIVFYQPDGRFRCSATLVSPTVLLTAAHCTEGTLGKTLVTFESVVAEAPPSGLPVAADPTVGYTAADLAGHIYGTAYAHPNYSNFTDLKNWNDVGVVVLSEPISNPTSDLADLNRLDQIPSGSLSRTIFTGVGYGTEVRKPDSGPQKPQPMTYPLIRRYWEVPGQKLTPQILQVNGNPNDVRGTGGSCFGDSGGPLFLDGQIVGVTSYGYTANCRYLDGYQRVDIPVVQDWLATFGVTP
ncbi:trypsin-like serine protease [Arthrobacter cupressi]|uniref:Trypsin n=1 Tax=Arthrobacter cupressi TaxID=1045773 RepID=A0A1G8IG66_9MICC|nr:trypsin-like serine protease [Arthrobacter cupressi]NYD78999.1 secreted trypsin-like serine protease [Arthrobacter cupressi]SDI17530.1 Trypsin [Arthrobacter cupressi]